MINRQRLTLFLIIWLLPLPLTLNLPVSAQEAIPHLEFDSSISLSSGLPYYLRTYPNSTNTTYELTTSRFETNLSIYLTSWEQAVNKSGWTNPSNLLFQGNASTGGLNITIAPSTIGLTMVTFVSKIGMNDLTISLNRTSGGSFLQAGTVAEIGFGAVAPGQQKLFSLQNIYHAESVTFLTIIPKGELSLVVQAEGVPDLLTTQVNGTATHQLVLSEMFKVDFWLTNEGNTSLIYLILVTKMDKPDINQGITTYERSSTNTGAIDTDPPIIVLLVALGVVFIGVMAFKVTRFSRRKDREITPPPTTHSPYTGEPISRFCGHCGSKIIEGSVYCEECGEKLT